MTESLDDTDGRLTVQISVRRRHANGQIFLEPQISLEGWTASRKLAVADNAPENWNSRRGRVMVGTELARIGSKPIWISNGCPPVNSTPTTWC